MKRYYISYTETYNNRGSVLTYQHPLEWLARKINWDRYKGINTIITYVLEIDNDDYVSVGMNLANDGLILSSLIDID